MNISKRGIYFFAISSFILSVYFFTHITNCDVKNSDLIGLKGLVLQDDPKFIKKTGKSSGNWLEFRFIGYVKIFEIHGYGYSHKIKDEIVKNLKQGDTVNVKILKQEFSEINNVSAFFYGSDRLDVLSLEYNGKEYFDLNQRNVNAKNDKQYGFLIFLIIGVILIIIGFLKKDRILNPIETNNITT